MTFLSSSIAAIFTTTVILATPGDCYDVNYRKYQVYRVRIDSDRDLQLLLDYEAMHPHLVDIWSEPSLTRPYLEIMVAPSRQRRFQKRLRHHRIHYKTVIYDVQRAIDRSDGIKLKRGRNRKRRHQKQTPTQQNVPLLNINQYNSYDDAVTWMRRLAIDHRDIVSVFDMGYSYENRSLIGLKIGYRNATTSTNNSKASLWIDAGIHAREWIAPATAIYIIHLILATEGNDTDTQNLLRTYDIYILPNANPDGYEYSRKHNRLWRKTRSEYPTSGCRGVDGNRNFGFHWGEEGATTADPCSNIYAGPYAFSENETTAMRDFVKNSTTGLKAFISLHSYGQVWLSPWGYSSAKPANHVDQKEGAELATNAIKERTGKDYAYGTISDLMYPASGTSVDYMQNEGIPYIYAIELSPEDEPGTYGFLYPPQFISVTGTEMFEALKSLASFIQNKERL